MSVTTREAVIIPFPASARPIAPASVRPVANRLSARDRIEALSWADTAQQFGYTRVVLDADPGHREPEVGDFLLVYRGDADWASWGVGCDEDRFMLWRPATGATVGWFATLRASLETILSLS